jgi:hypothetical protein
LVDATGRLARSVVAEQRPVRHDDDRVPDVIPSEVDQSRLQVDRPAGESWSA